MVKLTRRLLTVGKFAFVIVTITAVAFAATWFVSGSQSKASAAVVDQVDCPLNENEQRICPLDTTDDKVPEEEPEDPAPEPTPQVLGTSTEATFGK